MTKDECLILFEKITAKRDSIWALFLLNLPLAFAIISSSLSYDFCNLYSFFKVTVAFHKSIVFLILIMPLIILFFSWYKYNKIDNSLSEIKIRLNNPNTTLYDSIRSQLISIGKIGNRLFVLNITALILYVVQFYILFLNK